MSAQPLPLPGFDDDSPRGRIVECPQCGDEFITPHPIRNLCSDKCYRDYKAAKTAARVVPLRRAGEHGFVDQYFAAIQKVADELGIGFLEAMELTSEGGSPPVIGR